MKVLTLFQVAVLFLALTIHSSNGQIGELAKKLLPEWMTENLANLISPTAPPEKRILFKLNGNNGFYIRKVPGPTRGLVARPSKYYVKYALPQSQHYKMFRPPGNYIGHPYQFEKITLKPQFDYLFEKPSIPIAYQDPAPFPYYPPQQTAPAFESGPIHTIPAPNLGGLAPQGTTTQEQIYEHQPIYYPQVQPQAQAQTYQVTEDSTNDLTIIDPFTGRQKLYAPDPDPSLPAKRLPIEINPLSKPSQGHHLPLDVIKYDLVENSELSAKLAEHIKKQQGLLQDNPTPYNPTFLVTQSNNLLEQYHQNQQQIPIVQLFKPETHLYEQDQHFHVASPGQIHAAQLNEANQNEDKLEEQHFQGDILSNNHIHQGNAPGSFQYFYNDFANTHATNPKAENHFAVTHQQQSPFPYQFQQNIDKLSLGSENIKIYVPDNNYGIQSRSDEDASENIYTNHKRHYTEITRTPTASTPVREQDHDMENNARFGGH